MIRVLIADDHAVVRGGLRTYLDLQPDLEVVAEAADGEAAVREAERAAPDVVLLDLVMPGLDGAGALPRLRERVPGARVIVLTSFGEDERLFTALRAGAAGFLLKDTEPADLVRAIRTAHAGQAPLSPAVATRLVDRLASGGRPRAAELLTPRELEVLGLIARGYANKRIALELGVAEKTVKTHVGHVLAKLGPERPHAGGALRGPRGARARLKQLDAVAGGERHDLGGLGGVAAARMNASISPPGAKTTWACASASDSLRTVCAAPPGIGTTAPAGRGDPAHLAVRPRGRSRARRGRRGRARPTGGGAGRAGRRRAASSPRRRPARRRCRRRPRARRPPRRRRGSSRSRCGTSGPPVQFDR